MKDNLGPSVQTALGSQTWQTVQQGLMPTGKIGIDLDGSWVTSNYTANRAQAVAAVHQGARRSPHAD